MGSSRSSRAGEGGPEFLASVVDEVGTGVVVYDSGGRIRYANDCYAEMLDTTPAQLEGSHVTIVNPEFDREQFDGYWDSIDDGETREVEARNRTLDGERTFPVTVTVTHTTIDGREYHVASVEDITDQKERERDLEGYERLVENLPIGVYRNTPGPEGDFRLVNEGAVDIFEADSKEQLREAPVADLYADPDEREAFSERLREEGVVRNVELEMETFGDESIWCEVSGAAVEEDGETVFELALQDVTERKAYERELQLFREAVEQAGHSVVITDSEGTIEYVNPAFEEDTGYSRGEAIGKNPRILKSGKHDESFYEELWGTILSREVWESELINRRKSGKLYHVKHTIAPITDDDGKITNFVAIQSDITDQKLREKRLSELTRILRHNLRNTITALTGHAEVLREDLDGDHRERLGRILDQADALAETSEKVSEVRRLLDREHEVRSTCDLAALLDDLEPELREAYPGADVSVETEPARAGIDPETCRTVVAELVDNAVVHNDRETPEVTITATDPGEYADHVTVSVADDGPGIPHQERAAVEVGTEDPLVHSSGIGLSHVHWVVTDYGGDVTISDNEPRGSIVTLALPPPEKQR